MVLIMNESVSAVSIVLCSRVSGYLTVGLVVVMDSMVARSAGLISISSSIRLKSSGCDNREGILMMFPSSYLFSLCRSDSP